MPEPEEELEDVSLPRIVGRKHYLPGGWQISGGLGAVLADLIQRANTVGLQHEALVSPAQTRRKAGYLRNDFALALKALAMARSPILAKDERAAEKWVVEVFAVLKARYPKLKVRYPNPEKRPADFRRMFSVSREPPLAAVGSREGLMAEDPEDVSLSDDEQKHLFKQLTERLQEEACARREAADAMGTGTCRNTRARERSLAKLPNEAELPNSIGDMKI